MGLEVFDFIPDLVDTNPVGATDFVNEGDDHLRGLKFTLQNQFPNIGQDPVTLTALEINDAGLQGRTNTWSGNNIFNGPTNQFIDTSLRIQQSGAGVEGKLLYIDDAAVLRWNLGRGPSSSNGDFELRRFDNAGVLLGAPFSVKALTGDIDYARQQRGPDGTEAIPSWSFTSQPNSGMFLQAGASPAIVTDGRVALSFAATPDVIFGGLGFPLRMDGSLTETSPAYSFGNDSNTGFYRTAAGATGIAGNGALLINFTPTGIFTAAISLLGDGASSFSNPAFAFNNDPDTGMFRNAANQLGFTVGGITALTINQQQLITIRKENTITRLVDTEARTGWRYTNVAGNPQWAIYMGTSPANTLAFQRYSAAGAFLDIPFSISQGAGVPRMATLPISSAGLIAGELWRNPVSPGFIAII